MNIYLLAHSIRTIDSSEERFFYRVQPRFGRTPLDVCLELEEDIKSASVDIKNLTGNSRFQLEKVAFNHYSLNLNKRTVHSSSGNLDGRNHSIVSLVSTNETNIFDYKIHFEDTQSLYIEDFKEIANEAVRSDKPLLSLYKTKHQGITLQERSNTNLYILRQIIHPPPPRNRDVPTAALSIDDLIRSQ